MFGKLAIFGIALVCVAWFFPVLQPGILFIIDSMCDVCLLILDKLTIFLETAPFT